MEKIMYFKKIYILLLKPMHKLLMFWKLLHET